jgi:hypothetical protein
VPPSSGRYAHSKLSRLDGTGALPTLISQIVGSIELGNCQPLTSDSVAVAGPVRLDACMSVKTKLAPVARGPGRPSDYDEALGMEICKRIANGELPARICSPAGFPSSRSTLYRWRQQHPEFDRAHNLAITFRVWSLEEECLEIADNIATSESVLRLRHPDAALCRTRGPAARRPAHASSLSADQAIVPF